MNYSYEFEFKNSNFIKNHYGSCLDLVNNNIDYLKDGVIIDIGSNIGLFAKAIVDSIPYAHIHLFEPSKEYFEESEKVLNQFSNITFNNFAIGDKNEEIILYKSNNSNIGWNTLFKKDPFQEEKFFEQLDFELINVVRLDDYYKDIESVDFIKIDVEGYERYVLEGSWDIIEKFKPYLLIEVSWGTSHPEWDLNKQTYEKLFSLGYEKVNFENLTKDILFKPIRS